MEQALSLSKGISNVPEDKRSPAGRVIQINPSSQHDVSTREDHCFVAMGPIVLCTQGVSSIFIRSLANDETDAGPSLDATIRSSNGLDEAKQRVCGIRVAPESVLHTFEVHPCNTRFLNLRDDPVAFLGPKRISLDLEIQRLNNVRVMVPGASVPAQFCAFLP